MSCVVIVVLASAATGCNNVWKQKATAVRAAERLRELYNRNACEEIYKAAAPYFRRMETEARWARDCAELRARLGEWREFTPETNNAWPIGPVGIVWIRGSARFERNIADVRLDWDLAGREAASFNLLIPVGGEETSIPSFTGQPRE